MAIQAWWDGDPVESYWMEITDREDLGGELWAPKFDATGAEEWSYSLVSYVQPGDRVFHWHKSQAGEPAIIGWSEAAGPLDSEVRPWQARGTAGRTRGVPTVGPVWVMPLKGLHLLPAPILRSDLNGPLYDRVLTALQQTRSEIGSNHRAYAPFVEYGKQSGRHELRAAQGYLTKFPAALVDVLFPEAAVSVAAVGTPPPRHARGQSYVADAERRSAIERHAVELARAYYLAQGATDIVELGKPYDLRVTLAGAERHVEVKGSTVPNIETVQLTQGEVVHAHGWGATDLVVVDGIECWQDQDGVLKTEGGVLRIFQDWIPKDAALKPTHLRYTLPF